MREMIIPAAPPPGTLADLSEIGAIQYPQGLALSSSARIPRFP